MTFHNDFLEDEYEARLKAEDEHEKKINDIIKNYGCLVEIAEFMVDNNISIDYAEIILKDTENE